MSKKIKKADGEERLSWYPRFENTRQYKDAKLRMLRDDMYIEPTLSELDQLSVLKTEGDIDRWCRKVIERFWNAKTWL